MKVDEEKKAKLLEALDKGMAMIMLDARRPGVRVPKAMEGDFDLRLNVSFRFDPPDLSVTDWGVRETLSFQGSRFLCAVPWSAVYAIRSHITQDTWLFPVDVPDELQSTASGQANGDAAAPQGPGEPAPVPPKHRGLFEVKGGLAEAASDDNVERDEPPTPPKRGHLRVVK